MFKIYNYENFRKNKLYNVQASYKDIANSKFSASLGYGLMDLGDSGDGKSKYTQWIASGTYALNDHTNLGLEYGRYKRHGSDADGQKADALTFDIEAWF